jgi:ABC-type molybdate transport system substrate-binding protein
MNILIRAGIIIVMVSIAGTVGTAHNTVARNTGSLSHISVLAAGSTQEVTNDGFTWG